MTREASPESLTSRFVKLSDDQSDYFVYKMPGAWWSRKYEYEWASQFCHESQVVLDAACGVEHPLKFYLLDHCRACHACDLDERIMDRRLMAELCQSAFEEEPQLFSQRFIDNIDYRVASLTNLPYDDKMFDVVFCISTLEHLKDRRNKFPLLRYVEPVLFGLRRDIRDSLLEFKRVLRDGGLIILTFDYPRINLDYFQETVKHVGLSFAGDTEFGLPANALYSRKHGLYCFRAVLKK